MIANVKCPHCGETDIPFSKLEGQVKCSLCGKIVNIKDANIKLYEKLVADKDAAKAELVKIEDDYRTSGNTKDVLAHATNSPLKEKMCNDDFIELWSDFILRIAGIADERGAKKDRDLQYRLRTAVVKFSDENPERGQRLYADLVSAYPYLGNDADWNDMIQQTRGNRKSFISLRDNIIDYIIRTKDKVFAMDKFYLFYAKKDEWAEMGEMYLRGLLSNEEIAESVFGVNSFTPKTKKFMRNVQSYCNKYLSSGENTLTLTETKVWGNYVRARKRQRKRGIIIVSSVLAVALAVGVSMFAFFNSVDRDSVEFNIEKVIEVTYGDQPDLSDYTVSYKKRSGEKVTEPVTMKMLGGYDPEKIGTQTVTVNYSGKQTTITIRVNAAQLNTPVLTRSGNSVSWDFVPNAVSYQLYINNTSTALETLDTLSYDLTKYDGFGELSIQVRAINDSDKYEDSAMSEVFKVTKLQSPEGLTYENGTLSWTAVEGADSYELAINGSSLDPTQNSYMQVQLNYGDNSVMIVAKGGEAIDGVTSKQLYRISPLTSVSYVNGEISWQAEENADTFDIYVDGEFWTTFTRKNFNLADDKFLEKYTSELHTVEIVCKSNVLDRIPSDKYKFDVSVGNSAFVEENNLKWNSVGNNATYAVTINGEPYQSLAAPLIQLNAPDIAWNVGRNVIAVTATVGGKTVLLESAAVTKQESPRLAVSGNNWDTDTDPNNRYKIDDGDWVATLQAVNEFGEGEHTIYAKRVKSSSTALEVESDEVKVKLKKLVKPTIGMSNHKVEATYDQSKYVLNLEYRAKDGGTDYTAITSLDEIRTAGEYLIRARLSAIGGKEEGFEIVLPSEVSEPTEVKKLAAPTKINYTNGAAQVTAEGGSNVQYYYVLDGEEKVLTGGLISNLPQGIFEVYGRSIAQADDELDSENTPESGWAHVFNMNITFFLSQGSTKNQIYFMFGGCDAIDVINFSFRLENYDKDGNLIGYKEQNEASATQRASSNHDILYVQVNYLLGLQSAVEGAKVSKIKVTISITSGDQAQIMTAELSV